MTALTEPMILPRLWTPAPQARVRGPRVAPCDYLPTALSAAPVPSVLSRFIEAPACAATRGKRHDGLVRCRSTCSLRPWVGAYNLQSCPMASVGDGAARSHPTASAESRRGPVRAGPRRTVSLCGPGAGGRRAICLCSARQNGMSELDAVTFEWRGPFANDEVNRLHAEAFGTTIYGDEEWNWRQLTDRHSLGWATARLDRNLVGFVNVAWDGLVHAWLQDLMVETRSRRKRIGQQLVTTAADGARSAGCDWLHADFGANLEQFYFGACGFRSTRAGLLRL
jgi:GNAT superfamily N-acetyltransferase